MGGGVNRKRKPQVELVERGSLMGIHNIAVEATVSMGSWEGSKKDRAVTRDTENRYQSTDSGKWVKHLVAKSSLDKVTKFEGRVRKFIYENTLPWGKGRYLLLTEPVEHYNKFVQKMADFDLESRALANEFAANYPDLIEEAKRNLNGMWDERDYPPADKIRDKFYFRVTYYPIANADSFQVNVSRQILDGLREQINEEVSGLITEAKQSMWEQMYDVSKKMVERLEPQDAVFRDSLVENVKGLVESLKVLNFDKDSEIEAMRARIEEKLVVADPNSLRVKGRKLTVAEEAEAKTLRAEIAREAKTIATEIGRRLNLED